MKDVVFDHEGKKYKLFDEEIEGSCKGCAFFSGNKDLGEDGGDYCARNCKQNGWLFLEDVHCGYWNSIFKEIDIIKGKKKILIL